MHVHRVRAIQHLLEVVIANGQHNTQTDRTPETVTTANPVPEAEHVFLGDTELRHGSFVRAESHKMLGDMRLVLGYIQEPVTRCHGVSDRFDRCEGLASNDEERRFGIAETKCFSHVRAINVGNKVHLKITLRVRAQCFTDHNGAQVRTANTDVDDRLDRLARVSLPFSRAHRIRKSMHVLEFRLDFIDAGLRKL